MRSMLPERMPLFATLPTDERQWLIASLPHRSFPPATLVFLEGEPGGRLYVVLSGEIEIVKALDTAEERLLRIEGPDEFLGEMSLLNRDGPRTASARARTTVELLELTHADLDALLRRQPGLALELARSLSLRLQSADVATISDLRQKNQQLLTAYRELQAAQAQLLEKEALERELQLAHEIQMSMLPSTLPQRPGFDFGARMAPARAVGGDFFDFIPLGRKQLGVVIGDVSSKSVSAALFMALTRSLMRAEASRRRQPAATLRAVNRHLLEMNRSGMFVTVLYGVLQPATHQFVYARAGHELPLVVEGGEVWVPPWTAGMALGLFPHPPLDEHTIALAPGSALVLYTDGVTDAQDARGAFFGLERLKSLVAATAATPAQSLCERVLQAVGDHQGAAPQFDDVTVVAMRLAGAM